MQKGTWIKLIWWDHTSPLSGAMHNNCHKLSCITPLRRDVGPHKTSLAPSLFVEVSTKPEKSTVMLICARGKILCIFYDFSIGFGTVSIFVVFHQCLSTVMRANSAQARCARYNIIWWSLSVTCDRSVVFSTFLHQ
jgi:hypothetical protein